MTNKPGARSRRSFIFVPGLRPEMYPKALKSGVDMVCVELEDGIAPKDKQEARRKALALFEAPPADDNVEKILRINSVRERFGIEDLSAILNSKSPPPAIMMPKVRTADEVVLVDQLLGEAPRGWPGISEVSRQSRQPRGLEANGPRKPGSQA